MWLSPPIECAPQSRPASDAPYPVCGQVWTGLSIVDIGFFAALAYETGPALVGDFNVFFDPAEWLFSQPPNTTDVDSVFYEFWNPFLNLSVVSVRGVKADGSRAKDYELWVESTVFHFTLLQLPGFGFVPDEALQNLVRHMAWLEDLFTVTSPFWDPIVDHIRQIDAQYDGGNHTVIVVGHGFGE